MRASQGHRGWQSGVCPSRRRPWRSVTGSPTCPRRACATMLPKDSKFETCPNTPSLEHNIIQQIDLHIIQQIEASHVRSKTHAVSMLQACSIVAGDAARRRQLHLRVCRSNCERESTLSRRCRIFRACTGSPSAKRHGLRFALHSAQQMSREQAFGGLLGDTGLQRDLWLVEKGAPSSAPSASPLRQPHSHVLW